MPSENPFTEPQPSSRQLIQSVDRALTLLELIAAQRDELSLHALSQKAALNPSTAHRLLHTLQAHRLVQQNPDTRRYRLGLQILKLAGALRTQLALREQAGGLLERLMRETGETANLVVLQDLEAVYIDQVPSQQPIAAFTQLGARVPLHCTGVGKVLLAYLPDDEREAFVQKSLPAFTENTITSVYRLREELAKVREQGFALDIEERQKGVSCLAVPIWDDRRRVVAAMSISGPADRLTAETRDRLAPLVVQLASELSSRLGYVGQDAPAS